MGDSRLSARKVLPVVVTAQFLCTSLWFAANAITTDLQRDLGFEAGLTGDITSAVQLGFIAGTLIFAFFTISDRFSPSKVFFVSAVCGSAANIAILWVHDTAMQVLVLRFVTGFFLAGIYPVGMKIASDYHSRGLGKALGYLVGALTVGTALPHLVRAFSTGFSWQPVLIATTGCAMVGGLLILLLVPDGPYRRRALGMDMSALLRVFRKKDFRAAAFGYFGHMWELYAFWAFVPVFLMTYNQHQGSQTPVSLWTFAIIGIGGLSCVLGGYATLRIGSARVATIALFLSGLCCTISPFAVELPVSLLIAFFLVWGMAVIADSPQFSTLVAQTAPSENIGTALTIVNCIGFSITIASLQLLNYLFLNTSIHWLFLPLLIGPVFGLFSMMPLISRRMTHRGRPTPGDR